MWFPGFIRYILSKEKFRDFVHYHLHTITVFQLYSNETATHVLIKVSKETFHGLLKVCETFVFYGVSFLKKLFFISLLFILSKNHTSITIIVF